MYYSNFFSSLLPLMTDKIIFNVRIFFEKHVLGTYYVMRISTFFQKGMKPASTNLCMYRSNLCFQAVFFGKIHPMYVGKSIS